MNKDELQKLLHTKFGGILKESRQAEIIQPSNEINEPLSSAKFARGDKDSLTSMLNKIPFPSVNSQKIGKEHINRLSDLEKENYEEASEDIKKNIPMGHVEAKNAWPVKLSNGAIYMGGWHNGLRHGAGTQDWPCGSRFVGEWKADKVNGYGVIYYSDGDKYEG